VRYDQCGRAFWSRDFLDAQVLLGLQAGRVFTATRMSAPQNLALWHTCGLAATVLQHYVCCSAKPIGQEHKPATSHKNPQQWLCPASSNIQRDNRHLLVLVVSIG
jgi:hypothetical protein